jgi:hypothetical protein
VPGYNGGIPAVTASLRRCRASPPFRRPGVPRPGAAACLLPQGKFIKVTGKYQYYIKTLCKLHKNSTEKHAKIV